MIKNLLKTAGILLMMMVVGSAWGQATGEVCLIGMNSDNPDKILFVTLVDISASTEIFFTDEEWNGLNWNSGEGWLKYTAPTGGLAAGTVVELTYPSTATIGTLATDGGSFALSADGDQLYMYLGTNKDTPTTFLFALTTTGSWSGSQLTSTALTDGTTALVFSSSTDNVKYTGITSGTIAEIQTSIADETANWTTSSSPYTFSTTAFTITGGGTGPENPTDFTATPSSTSQIDLSWAQNGNTDDVLIVFDEDGTFTDPVDGQTYSGAALGGTVIFNESETSYNHTSLSANTHYFYKAWSVDGSNNYSTGVTADATTNNIPAPVATDAALTNTTSYTANWNAISEATSYRLDVATSSSFTSGSSVTVNEGFDAGVTEPTNWVFTNIDGTYTTSGNYGASSPSLKLDATGDAIETPTFSAEATSLSFWLKGQTTDAASALLVEGYNGSSWVTIENITNSIPTTGTTYTYNSGSSPALASGIIRFRFTYTKSVGNLSFDDVSYTYFSSSTFVSGYEDLTVNGTSQAVTGLTPNTTYYYRVRATDGVATSDNSNTITVTTDASSTSTFTGTGNWTDVARWSDGIPGASTNVSINGTLTVDDLVECNDFTIAPTGQVSVTSGQGLSINGDLLIASTSGGTGSFIYNAGDIDITGTTTVQRYLTNYSAVGDNEYHFISSPVTSQAIQPEFVEDPPLATVDFYKYDEPTNIWINTKLAETGLWNSGFGANFEVGKGYLVAYPTAPVTKSFTGTLNSYTSAAPLEITCTNNNNNGWNLLGNPFPSAIDWDLVTTGDLGDGMDNALYYYDAAAANYRYYIQLSGETGSLGTGSQYIPSGQGFMVHAQSAGTKTVTLYEDQQTHSTQSFYKNTHSLANLLELKLANDGKEDETTLFFYPEATNGFDGSYDAYKLYSYAVDLPQIYSIINSNTRLAINSMGSIAENPTVQLGFRIQKAGEHTLNASGTENFDLSASIILEDTYLNKMHDFKTAGDYTFASETGDFTDRFIMHFGVVGIDESHELNQINAYVYNNSLYVQSQLDNAQMSLYDIQGRQMLSEQLNGTGLHSTELNLPTGIYIVRLQSNNQVKNVKVFIN